MKAFKATHKHSQPARDGRERPCQRSPFSRGGGTGRHHGTGPEKSQSTKAPSALVVRWMKMGLGHSNNDLGARNAAPQPLRGGANQRLRGVPWSQRGARWGGWGRDCTHKSVDIEYLHQQRRACVAAGWQGARRGKAEGGSGRSAGRGRHLWPPGRECRRPGRSRRLAEANLHAAALLVAAALLAAALLRISN